MEPVFQTKFGGSEAPESEQGNCYAACLASIFEVGLEDVPDFTGTIMGGGWFFVLQKWLKARNLSLLILDVGTKFIDLPAGYSIASVKSHTLANPDDGHVVVLHNGQLVHDPQPKNAGMSWDEYEVTGYEVFTCVDPSLTSV